MRVLFCDNSLRELLRFRLPILKNYLALGWEVIAVAPLNIENIYLSNPKFRYIPSQLNRGGMNPIKDLIYFIKLIMLYCKFRPDIIFHYTIKPNIYGTIAAKLLKIPSVIVITGLGYAFSNQGLKAYLARKLYFLALGLSSRIIVLNQDNYDQITKHKKFPANKIIILRGGEGIELNVYK